MIKPTCDKCKKELEEFGGILLSPPDNDRKVTKYHLCKNCCREIENLLDTKTKK
jgi:hypothetical protein